MENKADKYLRETLLEILEEGCVDDNVRAKYTDGTPALSKFVTHKIFKYDLQKNEFPIPSLRPTAIKTGIKEILWIYQSQTSSLKEARLMGVNWWDEWNIGNDTIGERYGATVKKYDIIDTVLNDLETVKFSRRHIIDLYQYIDFKQSEGLYPCAFLSMFSVRGINEVNYVDLMLVLRSSDFVTAGFINQVQYTALLMMIVGHLNWATKEKWEIGKFTCVINNCHTYLRHIDSVGEILDRPSLGIQPTIKLKENKNFYEYTVEDFKITGTEGIQKLSKKLELAI